MGHEHVPFSIYERLSGHFFLIMGKKVVVPYLDVIMIAFFPRNIL